MICNSYYSSGPRRPDEIVMPYFAHPEFYQTRLHRRTYRHKDEVRPLRITFSGSVESRCYSEEFHFPILNRVEIFEHINQHFESKIRRTLSDPLKPITFLVTGNPQNVLSKHALSPEEYIQFLKDSDFFLAPPGVIMPHSHNIIEAMSSGAIPITNYGHHFDPPLRDGCECLSFETREDLTRAIERALAMPQEEISSMRRCTIEYYYRHLAPEAFGERLRALADRSLHIVVNLEQVPRQSVGSNGSGGL